MVWRPNIEVVNDELHKVFLREAYRYGFENANDKSTKNGSLLINKIGEIITFGCSGLPPEIKDLPQRHERPLKYSYVKHAERDAIFNAAKQGIATKGLTLYCPWYACAHCAIAIVSAGIESIIGHEEVMLKSPEHWQKEIDIGIEILKEAGVKTFLYRGKISGVSALINGEFWSP